MKNNKTARILKGGINNRKKLYVILRSNKFQYIKMGHRLVCQSFILNPENKKSVDHIDNDITNNKLINLRWATLSENQHYRSLNKKNKSGYKGVSFDKRKNNWIAHITIDYIQIHLGLYDNLQDAKQARITRANEACGVFTNKCKKI